MKRITLQARAELSGVGLFSAAPATVTIAPALDASGIVFRHGDASIPATIDRLCDRPVRPAFKSLKPRCTSVGDMHHSVATIEHMLGALAGLGVTDASIAIDAEADHAEIPIMDGSAIEFVRMIEAVGLRTLDDDIEPIRVTQTIRMEDGDASITIEPCDEPHYRYELDYGDGPIDAATVAWAGDRESFMQRIAPARTFCLKHEADAMSRAGLFTHLSPRDMLVIDTDGPIANEYRFEDECAYHKLLDLIGDLALVGRPLIARVSAVRSGHALAHRAARAVAEQS